MRSTCLTERSSSKRCAIRRASAFVVRAACRVLCSLRLKRSSIGQLQGSILVHFTAHQGAILDPNAAGAPLSVVRPPRCPADRVLCTRMS